MSDFKKYIRLVKEFGPKIAYLKIMQKLFKKNEKLGKKYTIAKQKYITDKIKNEFYDIFQTDKKKNYADGYYLQENSPIWVFWWQGFESAPILVQKCIESIEKNAYQHPVILITRENINNYVDIPDYIYEKLEKGYITYTHFSDILRVSLLAKHGGIWMDATIYTTGDFTKEMINYNFYSNKIKPFGSFISQCRWSSFFIASGKENPICIICRDVFLEYWKSHDVLIDYLLIDDVIYLAAKENEKIKAAIDKIPFNNEKIYELQRVINSPFSHEQLEEINKETNIFKLSNKYKYEKYVNDIPTFYSYIIGHKN
ncbi:capsular polysaccharide synthesis protein [Priestia megaterium]|uniref:capsular polysaccharide synthesis protein n=1 Tax=Priestia megaterium TaxID=1404 RepID=UPI0039AEB37E